MKVILTKGLPGSGKSYWSKKFCEENRDWVRVSRDDLRHMRGEYWIPKQEELITEWEKECVKSSLLYRKNVIIDATHLNPKYIEHWKSFIKEVEDKINSLLAVKLTIFVEVKSFLDVPLETCIKNDLKRLHSVGKDVIVEMYNKYLKPEPIKLVQDISLPRTIICDLDGTLCIHDARGPFEYDKCDTDLVNEPIAKILHLIKEQYHIIYVSGREDSCKLKTIEWLARLGLLLNESNLFMRETGDYRKDTIVKKEIFEEHIKGKYFVEFVLDDRNCVVDMWRELGLTCLQVADGDF